MAIISPFRALHYNTKQIPDLSQVIVPPYDNIAPGEDKKLFARSPYNFAHVILPQKAGDDYAHSAELLTKWREHHIVEETKAPAYYLYRQSFTAAGKQHKRDTLMCTVQLCDFEDGIVRPHENTYGKAKADRLQILRKTKCNLSHVFGMVKDKQGVLSRVYESAQFHAPLLHGRTDDGAEHAVWRVDADKTAMVTEFFRTQAVYIVDGHHRYGSALTNAKELGVVGQADHPAAHMLFSIANSYDPALVVFPTHRIVRGADMAKLDPKQFDREFNMEPIAFEAMDQFVSAPRPSPQFGIYFRDKLYCATPKHWEKHRDDMGALRRVAVVWSDEQFLKPYCGVDENNRGQKISYEKDLNKAWEQRKNADVIIFHAPLAVEEVANVADEKRFLPQKSTYFYPKLAAGLIWRHIAK